MNNPESYSKQKSLHLKSISQVYCYFLPSGQTKQMAKISYIKQAIFSYLTITKKGNNFSLNKKHLKQIPLLFLYQNIKTLNNKQYTQAHYNLFEIFILQDVITQEKR